MKYPKKNHYLTFKRMNENDVEVNNEVEDISWTMDIRTARFLYALDGRKNPYKMDPYRSRDEVAQLLELLEEEELLDCGERIVPLGLGTVIISLWLPKVTRFSRLMGKIWNKILLFCWLPVFILGVRILLSGKWRGPDGDFGIFYGYLILAFGLLMHELGHAAASLAYGGRFYEMGIMLHYFLPGAYVMISYDNVKNRMKRAQISAAGIESNMLLAGICLCLLKMGLLDPIALLIGAFFNVMVAVSNCCLIDGLDGMGLYQEFLGRGFLDKAWMLVRDSGGKKKIRRRGINGEITLVACYLIVIMQALLPIILLMNVFSIVSIFV